MSDINNEIDSILADKESTAEELSTKVLKLIKQRSGKDNIAVQDFETVKSC